MAAVTVTLAGAALAAARLQSGLRLTPKRVKPTDQQIKAADLAYRALNAGSRRMEIRAGKAVERTLREHLDPFRKLSIGAKLMAAGGSLAAFSLVSAYCAWRAMGRTAPPWHPGRRRRCCAR